MNIMIIFSGGVAKNLAGEEYTRRVDRSMIIVWFKSQRSQRAREARETEQCACVGILLLVLASQNGVFLWMAEIL